MAWKHKCEKMSEGVRIQYVNGRWILHDELEDLTSHEIFYCPYCGKPLGAEEWIWTDEHPQEVRW